MAVPAPEPGLVISFSYLWRYESESGQEEGSKNRPCVIILAVKTENNLTVVTVAPITHSVPKIPGEAVEIPLRVKQHLGLDSERSWVVINEVNEFTWPGYDLREVPGNKGKYDYGFIPPKLFEIIKSGILNLILTRRSSKTPRD